MATINDFAAGDRVAHIRQGDGIVMQTGDIVIVVFDKKLKNDRSIIGKYDRRWFELYPKYLFHRTVTKGDRQ